MKNGAFDYIVKGDDNDKIISLLHNALEKVQLQRKVKQLEKRISDKYSFYTISGKSEGLERVIDMAKKVARAELYSAAFRQKNKKMKNIFSML